MVMDRKTKQGEDKTVKPGDQTGEAKTRVMASHNKHYQGDDVGSPADFEMLTGRPGALEMKPKITQRPTKGTPGDALMGKKGGKPEEMPKAGEKTTEVTKVKSQPVRNSKSK